MNAEASPRPWCIDYTPDDCVNVRNADGDIVARVDSDANATLIVDAVNAIDEVKKLSIKLYDPIRRAEAERDRLRDIVRRLVNQFGNLTSYDDDAAILREARAAIGEDKP